MVHIGLQLFKWGHFHIFSLSYNLTADDLWPWYMTFAWTYEGSHIIINQVWFKSDFNFSNEAIFSISYNLTSDDLWPWYMTFDLINKWWFQCCICDPTLVEIHQSMWKTEPNVSPFFTTDNRRQSGPLCVFPAKAGNTKIPALISLKIRDLIFSCHFFLCSPSKLHICHCLLKKIA